jgi:drug/metabolite transporter (DMT)-like permease
MIAGRPAWSTATRAGVGLVVAGAAIWGLDGVLRAPLVDTWSPATIVLYEHALLTVLLAPALWRSRALIKTLRPASWLAVIGVAWGGSALATLAFTAAFRYGNPTVVVLLQKTQPLWAIAVAALVAGERPHRRFGRYLAPALLGVYLLSFGWTGPADVLSGGALEAVLLALCAAALWGSATAFGRIALRELPVGALTGMRIAVAFPLLAMIAVLQGRTLPPAGAPVGDFSLLIAVALLPGLVSLLLYYRGLRTTPAPVATLAELAFPATALIAGALFLDAGVGAVQMLGFAIVFLVILRIHSAEVLLREPDPASPILALRRLQQGAARAS